MIYIPNEIPLSLGDNFAQAFKGDINTSDMGTSQKLQEVIVSRKAFHEWVKKASKNASIDKEEWEHNLNDVLNYLNNATNFFEMLSQKATQPLKLKFKTVLTPHLTEFECSKYSYLLQLFSNIIKK